MSDLAFRYEMRLAFTQPRLVEKPKADLHAHMAEHWAQQARDCGRPGYREARGFTRDRWALAGTAPPWATSSKGREAAYGPFSRTFWKYVRLAMREAFLAEWHRALGTTYTTTTGGDRRSTAILTGIAA